MAAGSEFFSTRAIHAAALIALALGGTAAAQQTAAPPPEPNSTSALNLPQTAQLFGTGMPSIVKATAIINGEVITQTDVDQRLALLIIR